MPPAQPKYKVTELAGDGLLSAGLRSYEKSEILHYAIEAAAAYSAAARSTPREKYEPISRKLAIARSMEASARAHFERTDTEASNVQLALAYSGRKSTQTLLAKLRRKEVTTTSIADIVEMEMAADEKAVGTILCNYLQIETMINDFRSCLMNAQANGGMIPPETAGNVITLLRNIYKLADKTAGLYAEASPENPTMPDKVRKVSGKELQFFIEIRDDALQKLKSAGLA